MLASMPTVTAKSLILFYAQLSCSMLHKKEEKHHLKLVVHLTIIPEAHRLLKVRDFLWAFNHGWSLARARAMSSCILSCFAVMLHCRNLSYKEKEIKSTCRTQTR